MERCTTLYVHVHVCAHVCMYGCMSICPVGERDEATYHTLYLTMSSFNVVAYSYGSQCELQ